MNLVRTYLDASVILNAWKGQDETRIPALKILDDENRIILASVYLRLELLPKPTFHKNRLELDFLDLVFSRAELVPDAARISEVAVDLAAEFDLAPLDALQVASAIVGQAAEFLSFEKPSKPIYRLPPELMRVVSLSP
jgi:predicted nucleic acid-binding protein